MGWVIQIAAPDYERLREHLVDEVEQVAFLFTEPYSDDQRMRVRDVQLVSSDEFNYQDDYHVELADQLRPELIKRAWDENACLIEAHSHLHGPAYFSGSDFAGFEEWVPHLRWRLRGRPYAALVFAPDDFDALVWDGDDPPTGVESLEIVGGTTLSPTGYTLNPPTFERRRTKRRWWRRFVDR